MQLGFHGLTKSGSSGYFIKKRDLIKLSATLVVQVLLVLITVTETHWISALSFTQKQRLQFIEAKLIWDGSVQRADVCKVFGVTPNHLSRDLSRYRNGQKDALVYDVENRTYRPGRGFKPQIASGSAEEYLTLLQAYSVSQSAAVVPAMGRVAPAESLPQPSGIIEPKVLRHVLMALKNRQGVRLVYQSLRDANPSPRTLWPHTLVFTGDRWHARAFDSKRQEFRDFVLSRCSNTSLEETDSPVPHIADAQWNETDTVEVVPAPRLSESQKQVIAKEFGMRDVDGELVWAHQIRKCLVGYFLYRHRLENGGTHGARPTQGQNPYLALKRPELAKQYQFSAG